MNISGTCVTRGSFLSALIAVTSVATCWAQDPKPREAIRELELGHGVTRDTARLLSESPRLAELESISFSSAAPGCLEILRSRLLRAERVKLHDVVASDERETCTLLSYTARSLSLTDVHAVPHAGDGCCGRLSSTLEELVVEGASAESVLESLLWGGKSRLPVLSRVYLSATDEPFRGEWVAELVRSSPALRSLHLSGVEFVVEQLASLFSSVPVGLNSLVLDELEVTQEGRRGPAEIGEGLRALLARGVRPTTLHLSGVALDEQGLAALITLDAVIKDLSIGDVGASEEGVADLISRMTLSSLEKLHTSGGGGTLRAAVLRARPRLTDISVGAVDAAHLTDLLRACREGRLPRLRCVVGRLGEGVEANDLLLELRRAVPELELHIVR